LSAPDGQIKTAVMSGQRPNVQLIEGPEDFVEFVRTWVEKCWDGEPDERPTFGGEISASVFSVAC